jgi:putative PIN family toxin of toxin-antitoxin system
MATTIVVDTNVIIAGLRSARGASYALLRQLGTGRFRLSVSVPLALEYEAVAKEHSREIGLTHQEIDDVVDYICSVADHREIYYLWRPFLRDPKDDMVLELAVESGAEYIVTHNLRDFQGVEKFRIEAVSPGVFLKRFKLI